MLNHCTKKQFVNYEKVTPMLIESIIIGSAIYNFIRECSERQHKKSDKLATKIAQPATISNTEGLSIKQQITEVLTPFKTNSRDQQLQEFAEVKKSEEEQEVEESIAISAAALGLAVTGSYLYPPLLPISFVGLLFASRGLYKAGYESLVKRRKIDSNVLESVVTTGILATGHLIMGSIGFLGFYVSKKFLLKTEDRSTRKLVNLLGEQPQFVWLVKEGVEVEIPFEQLKKGNVISIRAGEMIPIDGHIVEGCALINQQMLTGESQPAEKGVGAACFAATIVLEGYIYIEVGQTGEETVAAQIGKVLHKAVDYKDVMISRGQEMADETALPLLLISGISVPFIGVIGGTAILASTYSYILRLISPITVLNFLTIASQEGILIKDGRALEMLSKIDVVIFDKTGTLTLPQPYLEKVHILNGLSEDELLTYTAAAEYRQTHPIALAILEEAKKRKLQLPLIDDAKYEIGYGIQVLLGDQIIRIGSAKFMQMEHIHIPSFARKLVKEGQQNGYSYVYVAIDSQLEGMLELHPTIRPEASAIIEELQANGKACYIISGDHEQPTSYLAQKLGIKNYFAGVLPETKADLVAQLQAQNKTVCFIGDGINDAIALKKANVSISLRGASTIATDTAQIVLVNESLEQLPLLFHLGEQFADHTQTNLNYCRIPAAFTIGGAMFFHLGITTAIIINQLSLLLGVSNSIHPMLTYQQAKNKKLQQDFPKNPSKKEPHKDVDLKEPSKELLNNIDKKEQSKTFQNKVSQKALTANVPTLELELI